jgi:hypothetical protein
MKRQGLAASALVDGTGEQDPRDAAAQIDRICSSLEEEEEEKFIGLLS